MRTCVIIYPISPFLPREHLATAAAAAKSLQTCGFLSMAGIFHRLSALKRPGSGVNSQYRQTRIQRQKIDLLVGGFWDAQRAMV